MMNSDSERSCRLRGSCDEGSLDANHEIRSPSVGGERVRRSLVTETVRDLYEKVRHARNSPLQPFSSRSTDLDFRKRGRSGEVPLRRPLPRLPPPPHRLRLPRRLRPPTIFL